MSTPFPRITRWNAVRLGHLPGMRRYWYGDACSVNSSA